MHAMNILTCLLVNEEVSICCLVCQLMSIYTVYTVYIEIGSQTELIEKCMHGFKARSRIQIPLKQQFL